MKIFLRFFFITLFVGSLLTMAAFKFLDRDFKKEFKKACFRSNEQSRVSFQSQILKESACKLRPTSIQRINFRYDAFILNFSFPNILGSRPIPVKVTYNLKDKSYYLEASLIIKP